MAGQVIIKKYSNRRLYDTSHKKYVTLEEIAELIREGNEIKVIDSQSNEDITNVILMQVILDGEKSKGDVLPTSFLHMIIKHGNQLVKDFFENYLLFMFQPYLSIQERMKKNVQFWKELGMFPPGFIAPSKSGFEFFGNKAENAEEEENLEGKGTKEASNIPYEEIGSLHKRIRELEEKIRSISKAGEARSSKSRRRKAQE